MWQHTKERHEGGRGPEKGLDDYRPDILSSYIFPMDRHEEEGFWINEDLQNLEMVSFNREMEYFKPEYIKLI